MSDCIEWQKGKTSAGYGQVRIAGKNYYAHRLAYCTSHGIELSAIEGMHIIHACDNPGCVNPEHLRLGTHADNMADMGKKGRSKRGEAHHKSKLTEEAVREIRAAYARGERKPRKLAKQYGVNYYAIMSVAKGKLWAWLK